jgi:hypothetical protein
MKTPRELLLNKHAAAEPKLDAITREVLREQQPDERTSRSWLDWLWPSPVAWGAVAAAWLVIMGFNVASGETTLKSHVIEAQRPPEMLQALHEQQKLFVELVMPARVDAEPARLPRPRSERQENVAMA